MIVPNNMKLDQIHSPEDLKNRSEQELVELSSDIRKFLIQSVSKTGGHLSSNLGAVELTVALHSVFSSPKDKIIWDVGHQAYVHKLLTGRKGYFDTLRQQDGLSGFPKCAESEYDPFDTGHASTSISAAYGMAKARDLLKEQYEVIAVIGDGSLTGGMAYEALNHAGKGESKIIVIVNDNEMAISHNVGRLSNNLSKIRTRKIYLKTKVDVKKRLLRVPGIGRVVYRHLHRLKKRLKYFLLNGVFFEEMGFVYLGPVDGHNMKDLVKVFHQALNLEESVIVHVKTVKGKGYGPAEKDPSRYHGVSPFNIDGGQPQECMDGWSNVFGQAMIELAKDDSRITAITAAMPGGTGLNDFARYYPERFFDVGIAEEHAVTFAAGMAKAGMRPVVAIYSTFLQRSYDQILHDVCITGLPVIFAVDRSGIVGEDGETHQGIYDLAYLSHIPGLTVMSPASAQELRDMLRCAVDWGCPCAIRYPKGTAIQNVPCNEPIERGKGVILHHGTQIAVLALGDCVSMALDAQRLLQDENIDITVANARFAAPLDTELIHQLASSHELLITIEDHIESGGFGMSVSAQVHECPVRRLAFPDQYIRQGKRLDLLQQYHISAQGIIECVKEFIHSSEKA